MIFFCSSLSEFSVFFSKTRGNKLVAVGGQRWLALAIFQPLGLAHLDIEDHILQYFIIITIMILQVIGHEPDHCLTDSLAPIE